MIKFQISLDPETFRALRIISKIALRNFRSQASFLLREALENRGFLNPDYSEFSVSLSKNVKDDETREEIQREEINLTRHSNNELTQED